MPTQELDKADLAKLDGQYSIRTQDKEEKKRNSSDEDIPAYKVSIDLDEEQGDRLDSQFKEEFEALVEERRVFGLEAKWQEQDRQYDGILRRNQKLAFNLHVHQSKIKVDAIVRALNEAFLESSPMVDVSPRPQEWKIEEKLGLDICEKQQQFIEYEVEENIKPERDLTLIGMSAVKKFVGIGKLEWCYEKEKRKREEVYEGKIDADGSNAALKEFENSYPNWQERGYQGYHDKIASGKTVYIVVEHLDTLCNCAKLRHVSIENFYVKNSTNYYEGLKKTHLIVERMPDMSWYDLQKKVKNEEFDADAVDSLKNLTGNTDSGANTKDTYKTRDYSILEATTYFLMDEDDEEETKLKVWYAEIQGKECQYVRLGAILYPYYGFDIDYIPFYTKLNEDGFYGGAKSILSDLKDSNIAQDALLNLCLHSVYIRNILTPIVQEGSEIAGAFIENRWQDGKPIEVDMMTEDVNKAIGFVQYPQINLQDFMVLGSRMQKIDDDVSGVSALITGRESPSDPHAPATKTMALLQQSGINIKDYIRQYLPSFNIFVGNLLQLYYQMSQEGRKFQIGPLSRKVTGTDAFSLITRDQMIARTNIQARAAAFAFDKAMEKQENTIVLGQIASSPLAQVQPDLYFKAFKIWMKTQGKVWENFAESDLLSPEDFNNKQLQTAILALQTLFQHQQQEQQLNGTAPTVDPQTLVSAITQAQMVANNPKLAQEQQKAGK